MCYERLTNEINYDIIDYVDEGETNSLHHKNKK